jgi:hypothetical protein
MFMYSLFLSLSLFVPLSLSLSTQWVNSCEDIVRRLRSTSQKERPHQKSNGPESWSWTSSHQNYEKFLLFKD